MDDHELGQLIENELAQADGWDSDELQQHREEAMKYYYNKARGDEEDGKSKVQSSDVADMVTAVLAQLTPMISTDALVEIEAESEDDEAAAQAESHCINKYVMDKNRGYIELQQCLKNAALNRNAFAKVRVEEQTDIEIRHFRNRPADEVRSAVAILNDQPNTEAEIESDDEDGIAVKVKTTRRRFRWCAVDPMNILFQSGAQTLNIQELRFFAEVDYPTRSDLVAEGIDRAKVDKLHAVTTADRTETMARDRQSKNVDEAQTRDQDRVERHTCFIMMDDDGDGISERWQVQVGDKNQVLAKEMVEWTPYACGTLFIAPHRLEGEDLFDRLKQTQDIKTALKRRWLDNVRSSTFARTFYGPGIDPQDVEDGDPNIVYVKGIPAEHVHSPPTWDAGPSILQALEYEDKERTERAGAALDIQTSSSQLVGETMGGIAMQYGVKELLAAMMAKNIAETLVHDVYLLFHRTLRAFGDPIAVRIADKRQIVDPTTWPARDALNVIPGLTNGQRQALEGAMMMTMQWQTLALQAGKQGVLVDDNSMYRAVQTYLDAKGVPNPEQYWVDPASDRAKQAAKQAGQSQQQMQQMQAQMAQMQAQIEQAKIMVDRYKAETDRYKVNVDAELKEEELVIKGAEASVRQSQERARVETAQGSGAGGGAASNGSA